MLIIGIEKRLPFFFWSHNQILYLSFLQRFWGLRFLFSLASFLSLSLSSSRQLYNFPCLPWKTPQTQPTKAFYFPVFILQNKALTVKTRKYINSKGRMRLSRPPVQISFRSSTWVASFSEATLGVSLDGRTAWHFWNTADSVNFLSVLSAATHPSSACIERKLMERKMNWYQTAEFSLNRIVQLTMSIRWSVSCMTLCKWGDYGKVWFIKRRLRTSNFVYEDSQWNGVPGSIFLLFPTKTLSAHLDVHTDPPFPSGHTVTRGHTFHLNPIQLLFQFPLNKTHSTRD